MIAEALFKSIDDAERLLWDSAQERVVLFCDLCDSTSYKLERNPVLGSLKTYRHNQLATDVIRRYEGLIVKYIGDEVMATFDGKDAPKRATEAAIGIQATFDQYNKNIYNDLDKIVSKIGLNGGRVFLFADDPQGTVVDVAARVTSLALPRQILCTADIHNSCAGSGVNFSDGYHRELKGIKGSVQIHEIGWSSRAFQGVQNPPHVDLQDRTIGSALKVAKEHEAKKLYDIAIGSYKSVLGMDERHFVANAQLAQLIVRHYPSDSQRAFVHAENAVASRPNSSFARKVKLAIEWHAKEGDLSREELDQYIKEAEHTVHLAEISCDHFTWVMVQNTLAHLLAQRYEKNNINRDRERAEAICELLFSAFNEIIEHQAPAFYDTFAYVLYHFDERDKLQRGLDLASKAEGMVNLHYPTDTKLKIKRKLDKLNSKKPPL